MEQSPICPAWHNDDELFALCRAGLFSAVIGDVMDLMGYTDQFLSPQLQPLDTSMVVVGRAMPVLEADDNGGEGPGRVNDLFNRPFGLMLRALDDLQKNEVYICTGASVIDFRCTIRMGAVTVKPGDIVFGDLDGVCVVPRDIEKEVIEAAWKKAHGEKRVFEAIKQGMGAQEAWDTFGIL